MIEKIGHIKNPLTVISVFAALAEISGTTVLPFIPGYQGTYIWFLMLFPVLLVIAFFLTLNFNHRVLYAPSDYKNEQHFFGKTSQEEMKEKIEQDALFEISTVSIANEAEALTDNNDLPEESEGINEIPAIVSKDELMQSYFDFEHNVLQNLKNGGIKFPYNSFSEDVNIVYGSKKLLINGVIETDNVHYLIEIKNAMNPSSLVNSVHQIKKYKSAYENYLRERNINVVVQPVIILPAAVNISSKFRGIPIAKFDEDTGTIENLKDSYPDYTLPVKNNESETLTYKLITFLNKYSRWGFSPLRIQQWGSRQPGFEGLGLYTVNEIRATLDNLLKQGQINKLTSKKGNLLYKTNKS